MAIAAGRVAAAARSMASVAAAALLAVPAIAAVPAAAVPAVADREEEAVAAEVGEAAEAVDDDARLSAKMEIGKTGILFSLFFGGEMKSAKVASQRRACMCRRRRVRDESCPLRHRSRARRRVRGRAFTVATEDLRENCDLSCLASASTMRWRHTVRAGSCCAERAVGCAFGSPAIDRR